MRYGYKDHFQKTFYNNAQKVVNELENISQLGIKEVEIYDDTFTWSKERLIKICELIIKRGIKLRWSVRDRVNNVSKSSLELMKRAGCNRIHLGIESGNPDILKRIKEIIQEQPDITNEDIREIIQEEFELEEPFGFGMKGSRGFHRGRFGCGGGFNIPQDESDI